MWVVCIFSVSVISDGSGSHEQELEPAFLNVSSSEVAVSSYVVGGLGPVKCAPLPGDPREREGFAYFRTPEKGTQYYEDCKKTDNAVPRHMFPIPTVAGQYDYLIDENGLMRDAFPKDPLLQKSIKSRSNWTNANQLVRQTQTCRIAYPFTAVDSDQFSTIGMYSGKTPNDKTIMMPSTRACSAHCIKPATKNHNLHANGDLHLVRVKVRASIGGTPMVDVTNRPAYTKYNTAHAIVLTSLHGTSSEKMTSSNSYLTLSA